MKIKFSSHSVVSGKRGNTIIDMIHKGETKRTENGEDFILRYRPDGRVKISVVQGKESWMTTIAQIVQKKHQAKTCEVRQ